jgi:hypothetical protein
MVYWLVKIIVLQDTRKILLVRSGIRTHARKTGLRPERSALDRSAILTYINATYKQFCLPSLLLACILKLC